MYNDPNQPDPQNSNYYQSPNYYQNTDAYTNPVTPAHPTSVLPGQIYPPAPPIQSQKPHKQAWRWYKRQKNGTKLGVGCLSIVGLIFMCGLCAGLSNAAAGTHNAAQVAASPTTVSQQVVMKAVPTTRPTATPTVKPTPTPKPTPKPTPTPRPLPTATPVPIVVPTPTPIPVVPTPTPIPVVTGVNGNPWDYDFNPGNYIYSPPANFCTYFNCITSFWKSTNGYVDECNDGTYSHSGGRSGACSYHGGELRPLFSH